MPSMWALRSTASSKSDARYSVIVKENLPIHNKVYIVISCDDKKIIPIADHRGPYIDQKD